MLRRTSAARGIADETTRERVRVPEGPGSLAAAVRVVVGRVLEGKGGGAVFDAILLLVLLGALLDGGGSVKIGANESREPLTFLEKSA